MDDNKTLEQKKIEQQQRNIANNAQNIQNIANVASKSANPYAKAAGLAVKGADKLLGGKASQTLGKMVNRSNNFSPGGRLVQKASNGLAEDGTSSRISNALSKKKGITSGFATAKPSLGTNAVAQGKQDNYFDKKEVEEQTSDGGGGSYKISVKVIKTALITMAFIMPVVVFMNLIVSGTQTYLGVIGLDQADKVSNSDIDDKIGDKASEDLLDEDITDENVNEGLVSYNDSFIDENNNNLVFILNTNERPYSEADLNDLEDFYSDINSYKGKDIDTVYKFFFKLYYIDKYYRNKYDVYLDLPLIMSTLFIQSENKNDIFVSNIKGYKITQKEENEDFNYYKDWSNYISSKTNSSHDIEILAQRMVTKTSETGCYKPNNPNDSACYEIDEEKYREFLKEFIEKKYYLNGMPFSQHIILSGSCPTETPFEKYNLNEDQLAQIASLAVQEQGTVKGAAAEASLMANLFELRGNKYGKGPEGLYNYIRNSGWFANAAENMDSRKADNDVIAAVKSVLIDGKRILPAYIDEHDYVGDISSATIDGKEIKLEDRSSYEKHKTKLKNIYGSTYTFYSFPDINSDPFGYTNEKIREEKGEFYYDFDTGEPQNCSSTSSNGTDLSSAFVSLALEQLKEPSKVGGEKYWRFMGFRSYQPWCASFVSWTIYNTTYNGQKLSDIIKYKNAAVVNFMNYFYNSKDPNIKFYYNDSCKLYSNKNGSTKYIPKEGDLIFFDNYRNWSGKMPTSFQSGRNHIGIVQYTKNGKVTTIEGNSGNMVKERQYNLNDCHVIGYGSWY